MSLIFQEILCIDDIQIDLYHKNNKIDSKYFCNFDDENKIIKTSISFDISNYYDDNILNYSWTFNSKYVHLNYPIIINEYNGPPSWLVQLKNIFKVS